MKKAENVEVPIVGTRPPGIHFVVSGGTVHKELQVATDVHPPAPHGALLPDSPESQPGASPGPQVRFLQAEPQLAPRLVTQGAAAQLGAALTQLRSWFSSPPAACRVFFIPRVPGSFIKWRLHVVLSRRVGLLVGFLQPFPRGPFPCTLRRL